MKEKVKKYEFTGKTKQVTYGGRSVTLCRIRALKDIPTHGVKKGDLGGWVEREENLSHEGSAWVGGEAWVFDKAGVSGNALAKNIAQVFDEARVFGNAVVSGSAWVFGNAWVFGEAKVHGVARISEQLLAFGEVK